MYRMSKNGSGSRKRRTDSATRDNENSAAKALVECKKETLDIEEHAENSDIKLGMEFKKPSHSFRRAWKYKVADEMLSDKVLNDEMRKCSYVSGRTQLACGNVRLKSKLDSNGFCEVHTRFFRQLKQLFIAEQRRSDPGFFIAKTLDEDGSLLVSDDDETLATSSDWPPSCEDLHCGFLENDDCHPLQHAEVLSEEECLLIRLALLEQKKRAMQIYRELLVEKAKRNAAVYKKRVADETKKGSFVATTRKEKALLQSYRAMKTYGHWMFSSRSKYMKKKSDLRLKLGEVDTNKFAYLRLNDCGVTTKRCAFSKNEDDELKSRTCVVEGSPSNPAHLQCSEPVLPGSSYCLKHIGEDKEQKLFTICPNCSRVVSNLETVLLFGREELKDQCNKECSAFTISQKQNDSENVSPSESLLGDENQANATTSIAMTKEPLVGCNEVAKESFESGITVEKVGRKRRYEDGDVSDTNVKYVVIASSDEDGDEVFKFPGEPIGNRPRFVPGIAPQFSTRNRPFNEPKIYQDSNVRIDRNHPSPVGTFSLQRKLRTRVKDTYTCARVRPFQRSAFSDEKERKRRRTGHQTASTERYCIGGQPEGQKKLSNGSVASIRPSSSAVQTLVHHIRTSGPKKVASGLHYSPASPSLIPQRINSGPGRASISANSNLQPPKLARITTNSSKARQSPSYGLFMDPSTISLGPSSTRDSIQHPQHPSTSYSMHPASRTDTQPSPVELRRRSSTNSAPAYVRSANIASSEEGRRYAYKAYNSTPRIIPNYRPRTSIIVSGSNPVSPFRAIPQDQYPERSVIERQSPGEHYYRRVERSYPSTQGARSRLTFIEPSRHLYHNPAYSPYQGNSITSRMREISRTSEIRQFQRYESYVDPFATDSRVPRHAIDSEAAAAVASIVNEHSDIDDAESSEVNEKTECGFNHAESTMQNQEFSSEVVATGGSVGQEVDDSPKSRNVFSRHIASSTHHDTQIRSDPVCEKSLESGDGTINAKLDVQDRQEDGLAVLALAAESHAAVRCRPVGTNDASSQSLDGPQESNIVQCAEKSRNDQYHALDIPQSDSVHGSRISAPYQIMGLEEEDDDDY